MIPSLFTDQVSVYRRNPVSVASRDALNNPIYGTPTAGSGWNLLYSNILVKMAFSAKNLEFAQTGERPVPSGIVYLSNDYVLQPEDRILTSITGIEYTVTSVVPGYLVPGIVDHYEAVVKLP